MNAFTNTGSSLARPVNIENAFRVDTSAFTAEERRVIGEVARIALSSVKAKRLTEMDARTIGAKLLLLSGPSAVGKHALARQIIMRLGDKAAIVPQYTTRPARENDYDNNEAFHFVSEEIFSATANTERFVYIRENPEGRYGIALEDIKSYTRKAAVAIVISRSLGSIALKAVFPRARAVSLFASESALLRRIGSRKLRTGEIQSRLDRAPVEMKRNGLLQRHFNAFSENAPWVSLCNDRHSPPIAEDVVEECVGIAHEIAAASESQPG